MTAPAAPIPVPAPAAPPALPSALQIAALLITFRVRALWNGVRARGRGRLPTLVVFVGILTSVAYVALFFQAFTVIVASTDFAGQAGALYLVVSIVAFGSLAAKAASSEVVLAGAPENEFLMARPVSLATVVVARCIADSVTDPFGALFLLPVLVAVAEVWSLPPGAWVMALVASMATQVSISALAHAAQVALTRFVPRLRRQVAWMGLRLLASLSLATLWMLLTWVLRAPAELGRALAPLARLASLTPGAVIAGPLVAFAGGDTAAVARAIMALPVAAAATVLIAAVVARRAAARGWEQAGPAWAEAAPSPRSARAPRVRLTAATKDLLLISRDRTQLLALVTMPVIFVGMQLFGSAGWSWSTASLTRVTYLAFSLTLYMATIGPLTHMQAERRAFWILRTVPVPVGRLLAGKARAWSVVVGGTATIVYAGLSLGTPVPSFAAWLEGALLVVGGAVGMTWLAVALASRSADLSDDQRPAIGPATIYTFLLVGGLYNVILAGDPGSRLRGIVLYLLALGAYWLAGVDQVAVCLDAEASTVRRVTLADGATMVLVYALGQRGAESAMRWARTALDSAAASLARVLVLAVVGAAALFYLARRRRAPARTRPFASVAVAGLGGAALALILRGLDFPASASPVVFGQQLAAALLGEELVFRGVVQRGIEGLLVQRGVASARAALAAAAGSVLIALVAVSGASAAPVGVLIATHTVAAGTQVITGRTLAAWVARVVGIAGALALARV